MKRKKKLEADKSTVYCPRTWCQGAAKSSKYPVIPADLSAYVDALSEAESDSEQVKKDDVAADAPKKVNTTNSQPDPTDRLSVCEKCSFAFCKVCYMGWHGPFARCYPRDPNELSAEEKASYDYIRMHTSPCPYCTAPVQKTMGCNHMSCFQCRTHFCYLCGSWLDGENPYQHFNKGGSPCYQRLWELEEGDEGQGPEDGRGYAGGARGWEQMAIEAARAAEEEEAQAAAAQLQAEEDARNALPPAMPVMPPHVEQVPIIVQLAQLGIEVDIDDLEDLDIDPDQMAHVPVPAPAPPQRGGRRQRNPFPRAPANGAAQAVRNHERRRGPGRNRQRQQGPAVNVGDQHHELDDQQQEQLQRFLEMARNDQEDGWDSDELGDDDQEFVIRARR
ncbi:Putative IBR domain, E3 ubiquitin ligase RBR family, TRIAD supradomain-containing protein [Septoria linicola]|uniref:IBR domain, E3 ubiquitin ligase RBR family, TRIAD supradomain-containing protein n=1 Tax=Septoria linicola TaxID=215465 RepID=A0A9Q9EJH3_9PEZI|nr:Putative IBR domain, E3 ubiquitin ligase RBR family, TRIAD supradomain-containing protein [Septoria linicola]